MINYDIIKDPEEEDKYFLFGSKHKVAFFLHTEQKLLDKIIITKRPGRGCSTIGLNDGRDASRCRHPGRGWV